MFRHSGVDVKRQCELALFNVDRDNAHYNALCQVWTSVDRPLVS